MTIFYSVVARGPNIIVEFHDRDGNFLSITKSLLEKIPPFDSKRSLTFEKYNFHYKVSRGTTYLCLAESDFGMRIPFQFLEDIQIRFEKSVGYQELDALPDERREEFRQTLLDRMLFYSDPDRSGTIYRLKQQADVVVNVLQKNMEKIMERENRQEGDTPGNSINSQKFDYGYTVPKKRARKKKIIIVVVVALLLVLLALSAVAVIFRHEVVGWVKDIFTKTG